MVSFKVKAVACCLLIVLLRHWYYTVPTRPLESSTQSTQNTALRPTAKEAASPPKAEPIDKRISSVWIVRETASTLELLLYNYNNTAVWSLPFEVSEDFEIPKAAALRVLLRRGLQEHEVETLHIIRHGTFMKVDRGHRELIHDASSYVAVIGPGKVGVVDQMVSLTGESQAARWIPISQISQVVGVGGSSGGSGNGIDPLFVVSSIVADDFNSACEFLEPFVLTSGKNPIQCLGQPPVGWVHKADRVWPTVREGGS